MNSNFSQFTPNSTKMPKIKVFSLFMFTLATFSLVSANTCFGYVEPNWAAIARNNERQKAGSKITTYNLKKELNRNKKQKPHKKANVNKKAIKKANKKQQIHSGKYKYDKKAEKARNNRQRVK